MRKIIRLFIISILLSTGVTSCNKYLDTPLPSGVISEDNTYVSDNSVSAVVTGNFLNMATSDEFSGRLACMTGLYMDELQNLGMSASGNVAFYADAIQYKHTSAWSDLYTLVFKVNSTLEGIRHTTSPLYYKNQWLGESYFIRALLYFNLTNLYGDVPLALTTDYAANNKLGRAPQSQVYQQIVADLQQAQGLLNSGYTDGYGAATSHRVRPNRYAAYALMAKTYLYTQKWDSARIMADSVIGSSYSGANQSGYTLEPTDQVFSTGSKETIFSLAMPSNVSDANQYGLYNHGMPSSLAAPDAPTNYSVLVVMDTALVNVFESGDNRFSHWVRVVPVTGVSPVSAYYCPNKYAAPAASDENEIVLRLAEVYLIRAEARAHLSDIAGAQADLDAVRTRAGLPGTTAATQDELLDAIAGERRVELFTEFSNRFFDLKRTGKIDAVMTAFAPKKGVGATWQSYMQLFPIPGTDIIQNPNLTPNPGYQQ